LKSSDSTLKLLSATAGSIPRLWYKELNGLPLHLFKILELMFVHLTKRGLIGKWSINNLRTKYVYIDCIILQSLSPKQSISMLCMELRPKKWHFPNEFSQKRVISILFFLDFGNK